MYFRTRVQLPAPPPLDSRAERAKSSGVPSEAHRAESRGTSLLSACSLVAGQSTGAHDQASRGAPCLPIFLTPFFTSGMRTCLDVARLGGHLRVNSSTRRIV